MAQSTLPQSIKATIQLLESGSYIPDRALSTVLFLALKLSRPLFLEGNAGVGKTELAKVLSNTLNRPLVRLQCYDGLDVSSAVYEWNYAAQMIEIRMAEASGTVRHDDLSKSIFSEKFLLKRPVLQAIEEHEQGAPVFLIDELDRADEAFEAFLLEVLSDYQVSIPEIGTIRAKEPPIVIITTNRTREIHDALKRRCFYHWVEYPNLEREISIVRARIPEAGPRLAAELSALVQRLRELDLFKSPGIAETLDWTRALCALGYAHLETAAISETLGIALKYEDDIQKVQNERLDVHVAAARAQADALETF